MLYRPEESPSIPSCRHAHIRLKYKVSLSRPPDIATLYFPVRSPSCPYVYFTWYCPSMLDFIWFRSFHW
ncbi:hypothetical protein AGMMS50293_19950 [Spirochaetia bacterium]|nr:hypothetical protein AGMMS50293_19950 [Spirochaetia bacterium]